MPSSPRSPHNVEAIAGLADLLFEAGDATGAEELLSRVPADMQDKGAIAALKAKMALAAEAAGLGNPAEFERRLAADPERSSGAFSTSP